MYEDSINESRAQLQAITLIIGTLGGAKVFSIADYETLVTKAALHGARLLKKSHQAGAVGLASHLWWQDALLAAEGQGQPKEVEEKVRDGGGDEGAIKAHPHRDSKRVLECLQKSLRIATSAIEEIVTVQLYCDALDQYLYYMDRGAPAVSFFSPKLLHAFWANSFSSGCTKIR